MSWRTNPLVYSDPVADGMDTSDVDDMAVRTLLRKKWVWKKMKPTGPRKPATSGTAKRSLLISLFHANFTIHAPLFSPFEAISNQCELLYLNLILPYVSRLHFTYCPRISPILWFLASSANSTRLSSLATHLLPRAHQRLVWLFLPTSIATVEFSPLHLLARHLYASRRQILLNRGRSIQILRFRPLHAKLDDANPRSVQFDTC